MQTYLPASSTRRPTCATATKDLWHKVMEKLLRSAPSTAHCQKSRESASHESGKLVAKQYKQSFELSHTPPLQNRVREEECLNKCKHAFLHSWNHGLHLTKRREYITNMDRLAQQAKAAPSYIVTLLEAHHLRPPLSQLCPSCLFSPLSSPLGLLCSIAEQLHPVQQ